MTGDLSNPHVPSRCPVCGAHSLAPEGEMSALLAVCDVLVLKALEKLGNYLVRAERPRHRQLGTRPSYVAHTLWRPDDALIDKALRGAWEVVPALMDVHGCCDVTSVQVVDMLDSYVHDLGITGTPHLLEELQYRFVSRLGLPVYWRHPEPHEIALPEDLVRRSSARSGLPEEAQVPDTRPVDVEPQDPEPLDPNDPANRPRRVPDRVRAAVRENGLQP